MARKTTKKQPEAPQVNIGAEIFSALRDLEKAKGIPVDYMVERLKQALTSAYRKDREDHRDIPVLGLQVVDHLAVDLQRAAGDILQAGDHPQGGGFAAA